MVSGLLPKLMKAPLGVKLKNLFKQDLIKKIRKAFIYQVLGAAAAFLSNVLLARFLGKETYGIYSFSYNLSKLLIIPALLGFGTFTLRYYPRLLLDKNWDILKGYNRFISRAILVMSSLIILIGYVIIYHSNWVIENNRDPYMIFFISLPFFAFINLYMAEAQAMHKIGLALAPNNIIMPIILCVLPILYFYGINRNISASTFSFLYLITTFIVFLISIYGVEKYKEPAIKKAKASYNIKEWLSTSLPMLFTSSLQLLLKQTDVLLIGILMTASDVGLYNAALKIDAVILFGLNAVNFIEAPIFSKLYKQGDMMTLQKTIRSSAWLIFSFTLLVSLPIGFFGKYILGLFGNEFKAAYIPLLIIMFSNMINALSGSVGFLMSMTKHQNEAFYITAASAVLCVILNFFLIKGYGITGAAIAIAIAVVFRNVIMVIVVKKKLNINATVFRF